MEEKLAERVKILPPSGIREFFDLVVSSKDVISLGVGEPDFFTPWHIREKIIHALENSTLGYTSYTSNAGLLSLREAISAYLKREYGLDYSPEDEILITSGVSEGLDLAIRAIVNPGDEIIIPEPNYVAYKPAVILAYGIPKIIETSLQEGFTINKEKLQKVISKATKAIILSYPNNPTGVILSKEALEEVREVILENELLVISDEIYAPLTYGSEPYISIAQLPEMKEKTILLGGFSKAYAMTGWRLGYAAAESKIINAMYKIHQYTMLCAPTLGQYAALEALANNSEFKIMKEEYNRRRNFVISRLKEMGLEFYPPQGAFYIFPYIKRRTGLTSSDFAIRLLKEGKVAVVPGTAFGDCGEGYIRISYATSMNNLKEALERLSSFLKKF
jgi:aminotransferase